jgi:hypothetical protein
LGNLYGASTSTGRTGKYKLFSVGGEDEN